MNETFKDFLIIMSIVFALFCITFLFTELFNYYGIQANWQANNSQKGGSLIFPMQILFQVILITTVIYFLLIIKNE